MSAFCSRKSPIHGYNMFIVISTVSAPSVFTNSSNFTTPGPAKPKLGALFILSSFHYDDSCVFLSVDISFVSSYPVGLQTSMVQE